MIRKIMLALAVVAALIAPAAPASASLNPLCIIEPHWCE